MYDIFTLSNGLKVVTEHIEHVNSIAVGVMVLNGSRNEKLDENGISHFIEHMFFKGTNKRSAKDIVEDIENVGGQINAYTSKETTCYYIKALNTHLDLSLDILSDMMLNARFDEEEIEKEKGVVCEEINMSEDSPEDVLDDIHSKVMFRDNPLAYPILGTQEKVKSFTRDKLINYIKEHYTPENSVLSICGKFDKVELKKLLEKYFLPWENRKIQIPTYNKVDILSGSSYADKQIEQLHLNLGLKGLPYGHEKSYALLLANNLFGGGASSILFQKVREELGLCYTVYSFAQPYLGAGIISIYTGLSKQYSEKAINVIMDEIDKFSKNGIKDELLQINKEKIKASYILGLESTSARMFANAKSMLYRNSIKTQEEVIEKVNKINNEDIDFVLKNCYGSGVISSAFVGNDIEYEVLKKLIEKNKIAYKSYSQN